MRRLSPNWILLLLLMFSAVLMCFNAKTAGDIREWFHWPFSFAGEGGTYLAMGLESAMLPGPQVSPDKAAALLKENERLARQVQSLTLKLEKYRKVFRNGKVIFSHLFGPSSQTPVRLIPATVAAGDSLPYSQNCLVKPESPEDVVRNQLVISRLFLMTDRAKQLTDNLPVLAGEALAGRIIESSAYSARLQLLTDKGFKVRAQVHRILNPVSPRQVQIGDRPRSLTKELNVPVDVFIEGDGATGLLVKNVSGEANIQPGDRLKTHPDDPLLPASIAIGVVKAVKRDKDYAGRFTLIVKPALDMSQLRNLYIVVSKSAPLGSGWGR